MEKNDSSQEIEELAATASVTTPDLGLDPTECVAPGPTDPCTIVIVGATGDLTARKLIPALFHLYLNDGLPQAFQIVGCARTRMDNHEFRNKMEKALIDGAIMDQDRWPAFSAALHYQPIDYEDLPSYSNLAESLRDLDISGHTRGNRIFYIALPPVLYQTVAQMIGRAGLSAEMTNGNGWSRIVVEKPFGIDLETAMDLDRVSTSISTSTRFSESTTTWPKRRFKMC